MGWAEAEAEGGTGRGNMAKEKFSVKDVITKFKHAYEAKKKWIDAALEDIRFTLGKQWDDEDVAKLEAIAVRPLTINKIRPNLFLLTGIEAQNRTDWKAFPKGEEDGLKAEVTTALLKNVAESSELEYIQSEQFEEALMVGECYLEPYLSYERSITSAEMQFKKTSATNIFPCPGYTKYDLSDAPYVFKLTQELSEDQVLELFPDKEKEIKNLIATQIDLKTWNNLKTLPHTQKTDYPEDGSGSVVDGTVEGKKYDLLEYYYKKYAKKAIVIDLKLKRIVEVPDNEKAEKFVEMANQTEPGSAEIRYRMLPQIWLAQIIGDEVISNDVCWSYPRFTSYPIIPLFIYRSTAPITDQEYLVQGITRGLKDLNRDYNKRRTQELRVMNTSANSGWQYEEGTLTEQQEEQYRKFGSAPGVMLSHKAGKAKPERIFPSPFPQGYAQLANERTMEMKEQSGINADLLAMQESQSSGRAIMLRQKQGLVMVQKIFDNNARTKKLIAKFVLSQLSEIFDVESAMRVMGDKWALNNFGEPVFKQEMNPMTGQIEQIPLMNGNTPQLQMTPQAMQKAKGVFNEILNDFDMAKYDVSVGEGVYAETAKAGNYMELQGMIEKGVPIPPDVLIDESSINASSKDRIKKSIQAQQAAMMPKPGMA